MQNLHRCIVDHYDREELRTLCFELGVKFDALPGDGTAAKARELILYLARRGELEKLLDTLRQGRPEAFDAAGLGDVAVDDLYDALPDWKERADSPDRRALDVREAQIGVLGDHARVEGGIHYQNKVGIAIVAEQLTLGIRSLPYNYAARIRNFLTAYLGTSGQPAALHGDQVPGSADTSVEMWRGS